MRKKRIPRVVAGTLAVMLAAQSVGIQTTVAATEKVVSESGAETEDTVGGDDFGTEEQEQGNASETEDNTSDVDVTEETGNTEETEKTDSETPDQDGEEKDNDSDVTEGSEEQIPMEPVTPAEPTDPEEPEIPMTPIEPVEPTDPEEPEIPMTPVEPAEPTNPDDAEIPMTPIEPAEPANPDDAEIPMTPLTPAEPVVPPAMAEIAEKEIKLQDGEALIKEDTDVEEALAEALIENWKELQEQGVSASDLMWEYECEGKDTITGWGKNKAWGSIEGFESTTGGSIFTVTYKHPALVDNTDGDYQVRLKLREDEYSNEATLTKISAYESKLVLNDGQTINLVYEEDGSAVNYDAVREAIFEDVVDTKNSTPESIAFDDVTIEYYATATTGNVGDLGKAWAPIEGGKVGILNYPAMGEGEQKIRISYKGDGTYAPATVEGTITVTDSRQEASVTLKAGASFTYNMDAAVLRQEVFNNVIDWENSTLPAKETLTPDSFVMEYKAPYTLVSGVKDITSDWAPFEGKDGILGVGYYPNMGVGEQQIRISYKGNAQFRPSENTETAVTVNKAKAKVTVYSNNIFAGDPLPHGFVSIVPGDKFDVYTIYAGATSNVTTAIYLDLPARFTDSKLLGILDPIVEGIFGKSFTQMMNDGITVGELRKLFDSTELLEALEKLNIDLGTLGKIMDVINKLPSIADSMRISFGVPNRAGLYAVTAVSDSPNYETGVGIGALLVKMRSQGVKLNWNSEIPGGKLTAAEAQTFDFGVTLSSDGDTNIDQSNVHYLYSGFTSKWRVYSSTTTPPTEPGRYSMTVVTLGGNYQAAPVTRTFQITK